MNPTRKMNRHKSASGYLHRKQARVVRKGVANGRYVNGRHVTKGRAYPNGQA